MKNSRKTILAIISFSLIFLFTTCEKDVEFEFDEGMLVDTPWGIPQILELGPNLTNVDQSAPTIFYESGLVVFGDQKEDYWQIYDARSILLEQKSQIWNIIKLNKDTLHVNKVGYRNSRFIAEVLYERLRKTE